MYREPIVMGRKLQLKSTVWTTRKKETFIQTGRGGQRQAAGEERTRGKAAAGRHGELVDCGTGQARLQLADPTAPHSCIERLGGTAGKRSRPCNPGLQHRGNKASNL